MANIGYATLSVIPSAAGFSSALSRDITPGLSGVGRNAGKVLGAGLLIGAAAVVAGIGAIIKTGVGEAMDASAGTAQLAAGIKSTGNAAGVSVKGINALASSIQGYSGQTDDSIVKSAQLLLTFTNIKNSATDKIFDRATVATANMAAKMGGDASASAIQLGKALNDPVKGVASLTRMGVQFSADQKAMIASLVETGDVAGAQNVILGELETQFGGAAAAAGQSLPGQLAIAKRSFEDVSQSVVEGLLPLVLPGLTSIGTTITSKVIPAIGGFIQGFKDGTGAGGTFRDILARVADVAGAVYDTFQTRVMPVLRDVGGFITGTVVPSVQSFIAEFRDGEGAGGTFRTMLEGLWNNVLVPLAGFITGTLVPAIGSIAAWISDTGVPALISFKDWVGRSKTSLSILAAFVTAVLLPVFVNMAVKAVASAVTQVGAWITTKVEAVTSAATQFAAHYRIVGGWIASAAAAVASGAQTVAIWALYGVEALKGAATTVASHARMAGAWLASKATAVASMAITVAAMVVGWAVMGVQALLGAAKIALAWIIALGPVGIVIAAVVGLGVLIALNFERIKGWIGGAWEWIKGVTETVWNGITAFFSGVVASIRGFFQGVWDFILTVFSYTPLGLIVNNWDAIVGFFTGLPGKIGSAVAGMWDGITDSFKDALNTVIRWWNDFSLDLRIPSNSVTDFLHLSGAGFTVDTPNIPLLASGALVTNPALAMLGESGSEAVLPFSRVDEFAAMVARQMGAMDFGKPDGRQGAGNLIDYDRLAAAMSRVNLTLDGRRVSQSADAWIGASIR